jgi:2-polyprenyl-3-methyl-5-hydroxy-6-metoxy-1,4-benzoquinol methylase
MIACPVCGAASETAFLVRDPVPVHQNLLVRDREAARALNRGRLQLHACRSCGFVFNSAFDLRLLSYGAAYDNTQSCSPVFGAYLQELAKYLVEQRGLRRSRIVEIGCGKGGFLRELVAADPGNEGIGLDPSYEGPDTDLDGRVRFEKRFFDESCSSLRPDAVVCRHVIEHIPDPVALLRVVRTTVDGTTARVFFETPCVEWILSNAVMWDFFYEHCSYFSADSLVGAFERAGFSVDGVSHTFGGQYLWIEARASTTPRVTDRDRPSIHRLASAFAQAEAAAVASLRARFEDLATHGRVAMWGAAAKGVTLANLVDPEGTLIACVVDLNPNKQGGFLPGTGHPIVSPHDLGRLGVKTAVLTNPNYLDENRRLLNDSGLDVRLVDLMLPPELDQDRA